MKLNAYVRILQAAEKGRGVTLSASDVLYMAQDDAIVTLAQRTLDGEVVDGGLFRVTKTGFEPKS